MKNRGKAASRTRPRAPRAGADVRLLFDANPLPMYVFDCDTLAFLEVNKAAQEKYGYSRAEFLARKITDIRPVEDRPLVIPIARNLHQRKGIQNQGRWRHLTKDGRLLDVEIMTDPILWRGRKAGLVVVNDLSERHRVEKDLRLKADALLHQQVAAMKASIDGMAVLDKRGELIFLNDALAKIHGYAGAADLEGKSWRILYPESELARFELEILPTVQRSGRWRGETVGLRRDGSRFPQEAGLTRTEEGDLIWVMRDITERKLAEQEHNRLFALEKSARTNAEAASRAKDEFLAVVSHELRTPMTAVLGWAWLLRSGSLGPEDTARAIDVIERNMKLQAQIIEDLLDVSAIVTGKLHLETKPIELGAVMHTAIESLRSSAQTHSVRIETRLAPVSVQGDPYRLQQVFWNLLSNAVKFSREGGHVQVSIVADGGCAVATVEDDGQGIPGELLGDLFDPFHQGESSLTRKHRGLGIGLAIVRHLVELHGGSVAAASPGPGKGASFTVTLPLAEPENPLAAATAPAATGEEGRGPRLRHTLDNLRVLIVDDEPDTLQMLEELLKHCGAEVVTASTSAEAYEAIRHRKIDLLVSDVAMPGEDGLSLIRRVRSLGEGRGDVCALALTARAREEDRAQALQAGFQMYLSKPVDANDLVAAIQRLAGMSQDADRSHAS